MVPTLVHFSAYTSEYVNVEATAQGMACEFPPPSLNVHQVVCVCLQLDFAATEENESKVRIGLCKTQRNLWLNLKPLAVYQSKRNGMASSRAEKKRSPCCPGLHASRPSYNPAPRLLTMPSLTRVPEHPGRLPFLAEADWGASMAIGEGRG